MLVIDVIPKMARRPISQLGLLLLLLSSSCACTANDSERMPKRDGLGFGLCERISNKISNSESAEAWTNIIMVEFDNAMTMEEAIEELKLRRRTPTQEEAAQITTAPLNPLLPRQDQSQIDQLNSRIQSLQQSAQQALQSLSDASRQVSQASQQLSQSSQQLSQQSLSLSQKVQQQSQELQLATISINSLNGALSTALSSGSSALASATSSAAAALSSALASASGDAATRVGDALAQATLARVRCSLYPTAPWQRSYILLEVIKIVASGQPGLMTRCN